MAIPYEDKSFWLPQYGPYLRERPLAGDFQADVAVVGEYPPVCPRRFTSDRRTRV